MLGAGHFISYHIGVCTKATVAIACGSPQSHSRSRARSMPRSDLTNGSSGLAYDLGTRLHFFDITRLRPGIRLGQLGFHLRQGLLRTAEGEMFRSFVFPILLIVSLPVTAGRLFDLPEGVHWTLNVSASLAVGVVALMLMRHGV